MTTRTLVIGGGSRVAYALRRLYPGAHDFIQRGQPASSGARGDNSVPDYLALSARDMEGYTTVINLVGTARGTFEEMMEVNAVLPLHFATEAARAGAAHFIALSSFSVFGMATKIGFDTPLDPHTAYGISRLAGERNIASVANELVCTIARCPILYGEGNGKLERLIGVWCRLGALPAPVAPVHRSMASYVLAARYLHEVSSAPPARSGVQYDFFADPITFEYHRVARVLSEASGTRKSIVPMPTMGVRLMAALAPDLTRSLYRDNVLDPVNNYFHDPADTRLYSDIANMVRADRRAA